MNSPLSKLEIKSTARKDAEKICHKFIPLISHGKIINIALYTVICEDECITF